MCTMRECNDNLGKWVQFRTQRGFHRGIVHEVNPNAVLIRVPRNYAPYQLVTETLDATDEHKLDIALTRFGYPAYGYAGYGGYPGYGGYGGYGAGRWGYPGYGAWGGGWWWWWLPFAAILALAFLW